MYIDAHKKPTLVQRYAIYVAPLLVFIHNFISPCNFIQNIKEQVKKGD